MTVRMSVNLSDEVATTVRDLAVRSGISVTELVRRAVGTEVWSDNVLRSGGKVLVELASGRVREIEFEH